MYNRATLIGRMTADPELKQTNSGKSVSSFRIAVDRPRDREKVDFLDIVTWGKTAEFVNQWFHKGDPIGVEALFRPAAMRTRTATSVPPWRLSPQAFSLSAANPPARPMKSPQRAVLKKSRAILTTSHSDGR